MGPKAGSSLEGYETVLPVLMTIGEAARYFRTTKKGIQHRIARNILPHTKIGGRVYILTDEVRTEIERGRRGRRRGAFD